LLAVVDAGPLYSAADVGDVNHARCAAVFARRDLEFVIPTLVVTEAIYFLGLRLGPAVEAAFLRALEALDVQAPHPDDWARIAALVEDYADFPLGGVDASVIALAERLNTSVVITLDRRHFSAVRPRHVEALQLLP
jgi:predicted nucleic acid-binding protein